MKKEISGEKIKAEEEGTNELLEQITRRLKEEWDSISFVDQAKKIRESEFEKLLQVYEKQARPANALANLLAAVESCQDEVKKLALFYKDTIYNRYAKNEKNRQESLEFALNYVKLLKMSPANLEKFKKTIMEQQ